MVNRETVEIGCWVHLRDGELHEKWRIVEHRLADAMRRWISEDSPLGRAVLGRRVGDQVRVQQPRGSRMVTITWIEGPARPGIPQPLVLVLASITETGAMHALTPRTMTGPALCDEAEPESGWKTHGFTSCMLGRITCDACRDVAACLLPDEVGV